MTPEQSVALRFPCYFATETFQPRFRHRIKHGPLQGSLLITVNTGYE